MPSSPIYDVVIAGAGIIGLSLALNLQQRGARIAVFDRSHAMRGASVAAAGMLAVDDPHNPAALHPLAAYSLSLYPAFLDRLHDLSGHSVPFQTGTTLQYLDDGRILHLAERSVDPRQLAAALLAAVRALGIPLLEQARARITCDATHVEVREAFPTPLLAQRIVYATGADLPIPRAAHILFPRKGQMLRVHLPHSLRELREVHRRRDIYVVPRTTGPQAGSALIGATVEDAGFDLSVNPATLDTLRALAAELLPGLADPNTAPQVESWSGLRPATPDELPILGPCGPSDRAYAAAGHYRNGILLATGTAAVLADLLEDRTPAVDLKPFALSRFA